MPYNIDLHILVVLEALVGCSIQQEEVRFRIPHLDGVSMKFPVLFRKGKCRRKLHHGRNNVSRSRHARKFIFSINTPVVKISKKTSIVFTSLVSKYKHKCQENTSNTQRLGNRKFNITWSECMSEKLK